MPIYSISLFIFRRDLRLQDNTGLNEALRLSQWVIPCFILDPRQIEPHPYRSEPGLGFMQQSLADLELQLQEMGGKLALYHGEAEAVIEQLIKRLRIGAVFINRDYTPFSRRRDAAIADICERMRVALHMLSDALLLEPEQLLKSDGSPYQVFTAFYKQARQSPVAAPQALLKRNFAAIESCASAGQVHLGNYMPAKGVARGGRNQALATLERLGGLDDYEHRRDFPFRAANSKLSPHLKFGTCSVREVYYAVVEQLSHEHALLRQLYWRDFFTHIAYHFPHVFGRAFADKFEHLSWDNNSDYFTAWCEGMTGYPIVDAGMRELRATGFMHNRLRMITASFLVKDLHVDWRWGERYFAQHLTDYDPCVNNGNWQWVASTGCDAQPYFRIFNPWRQQQKFAPDCRYIYRWIPELRAFSAGVIHQWNKRHAACGYPAPIIDHVRESRIAKERYQAQMSLD